MTNKNYTNTDSAHWNKMFIYYKWVFMLLFASFGIVLIISGLFITGVSMIILALYVAPFEVLPLKNEKKKKIIKDIVGLVSAITFIVSLVSSIN